jgi:viologen exporter family transport system permease protein
VRIDVRDEWSVWRRLVGARVRGQLEYRMSFAVDAIASFGVTFIDFLEVLVLFTHFHVLGDWTLPQVAILYGISGTGIALADMLIGHIEDLHLDIRSGQFDVVLLRPAGTLLQVMAGDLAVRRIGRCAQAIVVLAYGLHASHIEWTPARLALLPIGIVCATFIFGATFVLFQSITFWTVGSGEAGNAFTYGGNTLTSYPLDIFGPWLRRAFAFAIPLAFVTYFPGLYLLGKPDPLGYPSWFQFAAPLVAVVYCSATGWFWRVAVRHYRSTGS